MVAYPPPTNAVIATTQPPTASAGPDVTACYGAWPVALTGLPGNAQGSGWSGGAGSWAGSGVNMQYTPSAAEIAAGGADVVFTANANGTCPDASDPLHINISNSFVNAAVTPVNAACYGVLHGKCLPGAERFRHHVHLEHEPRPNNGHCDRTRCGQLQRNSHRCAQLLDHVEHNGR